MYPDTLTSSYQGLLGNFRTKAEYTTSQRYYLDPSGCLFQVLGRIKACFEYTGTLEFRQDMTSPDGYTETYKYDFFFVDGVLDKVNLKW